MSASVFSSSAIAALRVRQAPKDPLGDGRAAAGGAVSAVPFIGSQVRLPEATTTEESQGQDRGQGQDQGQGRSRNRSQTRGQDWGQDQGPQGEGISLVAEDS